MVELSIVVPVYNSEHVLAELCRQTAEALAGTPFELVLVNDQSTDNSWPNMRRLCEDDPRIIGVNLRKNAGQDSAILCGMRLTRGRYVAVMDDDLQHSPFDLPALYAQCCERDLDVCYAHFPALKAAGWKKAGSWLNGKLAEIVIDKPKGLYLSPFKIMRREIAEEIVKYTGPFPYVDGLILGVTDNVAQIEIDHNARYEGKGHYTLAKSVLVFLRVATGFSVWPLRFSSCLGIFCAVCGFILALYYLVEFAVLNNRVEGWITLVILQLMLGGLLLFAVGVVGEYLGRLYLNCSGKPQATVKEICGGRTS